MTTIIYMLALLSAALLGQAQTVSKEQSWQVFKVISNTNLEPI